MAKAIRFKDKSGEYTYTCPYFPVGYVYISTVNINPATYFGGKWEQIKDRFLLACGNNYSNGAIGGEATHKLTIEEMPSHNHKLRGSPSKYNVKIETAGYGDENTGNVFNMDNTGGDQPHNNMPPYIAVYMFKRIA